MRSKHQHIGKPSLPLRVSMLPEVKIVVISGRGEERAAEISGTAPCPFMLFVSKMKPALVLVASTANLENHTTSMRMILQENAVLLLNEQPCFRVLSGELIYACVISPSDGPALRGRPGRPRKT